MSSILKALRKLEEEKAAVGEGNVDIAHDILKGSASRPTRSLLWPLVSLVLFTLVIGAGLYIWSVLPQRAPVSGQTAALPAPVSVETRKPVRLPAPVTPRVETPAVVQPPAPDQPKNSAPVTVSAPAAAPSKPPVVQAEASAFDAEGLPFLILTGIAYRENPAERIAIINDLPVMQGTAIEGAEVVEILADRVILKWKGKRVEKRLSAKN